MPRSIPMPHKKPAAKPVPPLSATAFEQAWSSRRAPQTPPPPTVSGRWLLGATAVALVAAAACAWLTLCFLFWQGSWQLLYHPDAVVTRTPASAGMAFDPVAFASTGAGEPRLKGWWIPAAADARYSRYTVLYLHSQTGNLGNAVDDLATLHSVGVNILAFDYRGYGQSQFIHPSEAHWREDAESALAYLTATRHVPAGTILLDGRALGANLALEVAAAHPDLAGVAMEQPLNSPVDTIFSDARSRLVPARLLVSDRYEVDATAVRIPSLWLMAEGPRTDRPASYDRVAGANMLVWLPAANNATQSFKDACTRWLDDLPAKGNTP